MVASWVSDRGGSTIEIPADREIDVSPLRVEGGVPGDGVSIEIPCVCAGRFFIPTSEGITGCFWIRRLCDFFAIGDFLGSRSCSDSIGIKSNHISAIACDANYRVINLNGAIGIVYIFEFDGEVALFIDVGNVEPTVSCIGSSAASDCETHFIL